MADLTHALEVALGGTFTDVTDILDGGFQCSGGRQRAYDTFNAGTCTFTIDDRTGDYVPGAGGLWSGESWIGREVRITVTVGGHTSVIWRGHVDDLDVQVEGFFFAGVKVTAVEPLALLGRSEITDGTTFDSELSSVRIGNVLALPEVDSGYFDANTTDITAGDTTLQAETDAGGNTLQYLQLVEASEGGRLFMRHGDTDGGVLAFRPRSATSGDSGLTFQDEEDGSASLVDGGTAATSSFDGTWDGGTAASDDYGIYSDVYDDIYDGLNGGDAETRFLIPYESVEFAFAGVTQLVNRVTYTREGGTAQTVEDATSRGQYGPRAVSKSGLLNASDADVLDLAGTRIARASQPRRDVAGLVLLLDLWGDDQAAMVLRTTVGDRVKVVTNPPGYLENGPITSLVRIEQVTHRVSADSHTIAYRLTTLSDEFGGLVDGGTAETTTFGDTYDGGTAETVSFDGALDGGTAVLV